MAGRHNSDLCSTARDLMADNDANRATLHPLANLACKYEEQELNHDCHKPQERGSAAPTPAWISNILARGERHMPALSPMERLNRRNPNLHLNLGPPSLRQFGEPDLATCVRYYRQFWNTVADSPDDGVAILKEFLTKHATEWDCSGWVWAATGYLMHMCPNRQGEARAKSWMNFYWRFRKSPKHQKDLQKIWSLFRAHQKLGSPHIPHLKAVIRWIIKASQTGAGGSWADFEKVRPKHCSCIRERSFGLLKSALRTVERQDHPGGGAWPAPSTVLLQAVATAHNVSVRELAQFRADARKRSKNLHKSVPSPEISS